MVSGRGPFKGFDAAAPRYDADEAGNRVLAHMRARVERQLWTAFPPGSRLIELGSGTGTDAARLVANRGCRVALVDPSPQLLECACAKVRAARIDGLLGAHPLRAASVQRLSAIYGKGFFDGAYSNLGPLNCEPRLGPVAEGLRDLVRPGGALVLSIINRWCPSKRPGSRCTASGARPFGAGAAQFGPRPTPAARRTCAPGTIRAALSRARSRPRSTSRTSRRCRCSGLLRISISWSLVSNGSSRRSNPSSDGRQGEPCCATSAITFFSVCAVASRRSCTSEWRAGPGAVA